MSTLSLRARAPWWLLPVVGLLLWAVLSLWPSLWRQAMWWWQVLQYGPGDDVAAILWYHGTLPRLCMAVLVGAALGLSGCLVQQLSGNPLASPMTLGAASGAWLAMVCATVWWPALLARHPDWLAMAGAAAASALLLLITGLRRLASLQLVLAGMALSILLGTLATAVTLLHDQYALGIAVWGAGDLTQIDWHWVPWLCLRLIPPLLLLPLLQRPLQVLRLGAEGAGARGLALVPALLGVLLLALWLSAVAIAAVGLIGFVSILTPALARQAGARTVAAQWRWSALLGAGVLLLTDGLAQWASTWSADTVPTGAAAALIGAPVLIWLLRDVRTMPDNLSAPPPGASMGWGRWLGWSGLLAGALLALLLSRSPAGWQLAWPEAGLWWLRWPRLLAAAAAGVGLSTAGVILQRLLHNPLASPDLLGVSAGAALAMLLAAGLSAAGLAQGGYWPALLGSLCTLALVLLLGRRCAWAPGALALAGLGLSALLDGLVQFVLARGNLDTMAALTWLAGSSYRIAPAAAGWLCLGVSAGLALALLARRSLTLLALGDAMAAGRGLALGRARAGWLLLAAMLCALVTSLLGPIAFIGLLMPHLALRLGARSVGGQLLAAALAGAALMALADALGRTLRYPQQLPVGLCAGLLCGGLLVLALLWQRGGAR